MVGAHHSALRRSPESSSTSGQHSLVCAAPMSSSRWLVHPYRDTNAAAPASSQNQSGSSSSSEPGVVVSMASSVSVAGVVGDGASHWSPLSSSPEHQELEDAGEAL
eukprot:scaffold100_cov357-Prasinococcus_capsulatus_cf.AAC.4